MSGTSLDGLDMALCEFANDDISFNFKIISAKTIDYSTDWKDKLVGSKNLSAEAYFKLHAQYGKYIADEINHFLKNNKIKPAAIASHGHTVFHQPNLGFTTQLGCGATIAAHTGITTVCDFRSLDVANDGQGAPLVPMGDKCLFGKYEACLNIGGIANISYDDNGKRMAYDVCEANMLLNFLAQKKGLLFDRGGEMAKSGSVNVTLLKQLNQLPYYFQSGAKSIGREWFETTILKLFDQTEISVSDLLATATEHIAQIIAKELNDKKLKNVLVTGGGTFNTFLIEHIQTHSSCKINIPDAEIINFKEALIFAFLGYLRLREMTNTLNSVTGARVDSIGGAVYFASENN